MNCRRLLLIILPVAMLLVAGLACNETGSTEERVGGSTASPTAVEAETPPQATVPNLRDKLFMSRGGGAVGYVGCRIDYMEIRDAPLPPLPALVWVFADQSYVNLCLIGVPSDSVGLELTFFMDQDRVAASAQVDPWTDFRTYGDVNVSEFWIRLPHDLFRLYPDQARAVVEGSFTAAGPLLEDMLLGPVDGPMLATMPSGSFNAFDVSRFEYGPGQPYVLEGVGLAPDTRYAVGVYQVLEGEEIYLYDKTVADADSRGMIRFENQAPAEAGTYCAMVLTDPDATSVDRQPHSCFAVR